METFLGTMAGIIFGGMISFIISRFYYKKSIKTKNLSCYVQFVSEILTDIDPEVKQKLDIEYDGQKVDSIYQVQFIIANTGDFPVRDVIKPLTLEIPNNAEVLDTNLLHIEPNGREINLQTLKSATFNSVEFKFPLLNSGEYFVVKLLVKGEAPSPEPKKSENDSETIISMDYFEFGQYNLFKFRITVDDLPPEIRSERLPNDYSEFYTSSFDKTVIWIGCFIGLIAFILGYLLYSLKGIRSDLFLFNFSEFFTTFNFLKFSIIIGWLIVLLQVLSAIAIPGIEFSNTRNRRSKTKFKLPRKLNDNKAMRYLG